MKKLAIALSIFAATASAQAECTFKITSANEDVFIALEQSGWNFPEYDMVCERLKKADAQLIITGSADILRSAVVGWAFIGLKDNKTGVTTFSFGGRSTTINTEQESINRDQALKLLSRSANSAASTLAKTIDEAVDALEAERKKAAVHYRSAAGKARN